MHQHRSEPRGAHRLGLPMAMAKYAAAIGRIDFDRFSGVGRRKAGRGRKLPTMVCTWPFESQG